MLVFLFTLPLLISVTDVEITEPEHCAAYNLDELPAFRVIVQNENEIPDSVHYSLNGEDVVSVSRLKTDWPTYMQSYLHHGFSESPAPIDNTILWTAQVTGNEHEFPTPVVVDGIVYYPSNMGTDSLYALDAATGELIWKQRVGNTDDAVTVHEGLVYSASDSLFCFDALTGEKIWASAAGTEDGSTPVVANDRVYCGLWTGQYPDYSAQISCLETVDGSVIWTSTLPECVTVSCASLWENMLLVPTFNFGNPGSIFALDTADGSVIWENSDCIGGYWDSSPVIVDDDIYINGFDGKIRAIDLVSGNTVWETATASIDFATATPAYHDGVLYFANDANEPVDEYFFSVNTLTGSIGWSVPGSQHGSSAVADGIVFYGDNLHGSMGDPDGYGSLVALSCSSGEEVWRFDAGDTTWVAGSPSVVDGIVYLPITDWNLYAFGTGLKYTYTGTQLNSVVGWNELIATSFDGGEPAASDTISYYINQTGIEFGPSMQLDLACSPNPCISGTTISFSLTETGFTSIRIYDLTGRDIDMVVDSYLSSGSYTISWDGMMQSNECVSSGLYICRIESGGIIETTGLCVLR